MQNIVESKKISNVTIYTFFFPQPSEDKKHSGENAMPFQGINISSLQIHLNLKGEEDYDDSQDGRKLLKSIEYHASLTKRIDTEVKIKNVQFFFRSFKKQMTKSIFFLVSWEKLN